MTQAAHMANAAPIVGHSFAPCRINEKQALGLPKQGVKMRIYEV